MKKFMMAALGGTVAGALISTQVAAPLLAQEASKSTSVYEQLDLFGDIFERIRTDYVEQVDDKKLIEAAINGMLGSLDPHSSYLPPDDYDDMRVQTRARHRGHAGRGLHQGRLADGWHPRRRRRDRGGRFHHACRW
jgi:carboxyl-terminal processing protease